MTEHAEYLKRRYFGSLNGLRCLAIMAVLWYHGPGMRGGSILSRNPFTGVQLFFAISGFVIATRLIRERDSRGGIWLSKFYLRRSLRILPLYYTVLAVHVVLAWQVAAGSPRQVEFNAGMPAFLTFTSNWFVSAGTLFGFSWSIATQEQFYWSWPLVESYFKRYSTLAVVLGIAMTQALRFGLIPGFPDGSLPHRIIASVPLTIGLGILLAHLLHSPTGYRVAAAILGWRGASLAALSLLVWLISSGIPRIWIEVWIVVVVGACVVKEDHWLQRVLTSWPVQYVGVVSFGVYLFHGLVYDTLQELSVFEAHSVAQFGACLAVSVAVASASYHYYESWFLKREERLSPVVAQTVQYARAVLPQ